MIDFFIRAHAYELFAETPVQVVLGCFNEMIMQGAIVDPLPLNDTIREFADLYS